jgi:hypothetical protein
MAATSAGVSSASDSGMRVVMVGGLLKAGSMPAQQSW